VETIIVIAVLVVGALVGAVVALTIAAREESRRRNQPPGREVIEGEILREIVLRGGATERQAVEEVRAARGIETGSRGRIDLGSWVARLGGMLSANEKEAFLDAAVAIATTTGRTFPLEQYAALLDISFGLGFHSDALSRLQRKHGFAYVDWAKNARPQNADRGGARAPLFARSVANVESDFEILGLSAGADRAEIIAAYRKLAATVHPDRFHDSTQDEWERASERFREITRAYESLLQASDRD
jgi:DnaJ-domain-containing protein 1